MKRKYRKSLITLFLSAVAALLLAACLSFVRPSFVYAADRYVTLDGTNIFYTAIRGAEVTEGAEGEKHYTLFKIGDDETVSYRKSLAYSWYSGVFGEDGNPTGESKSNSLQMTIGFDSINFSRFIIEFQSQQYLKNDDNKTVNYLVFEPDAATQGNVTIGATADLEKPATETVSVKASDNEKIKIGFGTFDAGNVKLEINGEERDLTFTNVYYPYANYVSSGDSAVTPLIFRAEFDDEPAEGEEPTADMKLYELNGQSFELQAHDSDDVYNDVVDTAPPVMCFTRTPSYVEFGKEISFNYQLIDVLASSPRATACFYVLSGDQYVAEDFDYMKTEYAEEEEGGEPSADKYEYPYIKVTSGSDICVFRDAQTFVPADYLEGGDKYSEDYTVYGLIKVYFEVSDVTGSTAQTDKVFVDWYAKDEAIVNIYDLKSASGVTGNEKNKGNFLKIIDGKEGVTYAKTNDTTAADGDYLAAYKQTVKELQEAYQTKIDSAIEALEDGKLYAGGDSNFYLPAYDLLAQEGVIGDEYFDIYDYKYSIYYKGNTTGSNLSLDYNKLSIPLNDADATYRFTVFITDAFDNPMRYPDKDSEGHLIWKEITKDDVWEEDFFDLLPFFEFSVSYKMATAKNPESLSVAYVGTSYSGVSFDVKNNANTAVTKYNLYIFDRNGAYRDLSLDLNYAQFVENFEKLFDNTYEAGKDTRKYFKTVKPASQLKETDADYDLFKAINWSDSAVSFTPQSAEDFYVVKLTLTDKRTQDSSTYFATVAASIQANPLKGETEWLRNNMPAIVLFSIAGVLFIAFVLLLVIRPKDKGDIDEVYEKSGKGKKSKKAEK